MDFPTELKTYAGGAVRLMSSRVKDTAAKALADDFLDYIAKYKPPAQNKLKHPRVASEGNSSSSRREKKIFLFMNNKGIQL